MLNTQIVLVGIRRTQVRINKEDTCSTKCPKGISEVYSVINRFAGEWIRVASRPEGIAQGTERTTGCIRKSKSGSGGKWGLSVELKVVLGLQDIIKHADAATDTGLGVLERLPGKAEPWREVISVREIGACRGPFVSGENQADGSPRKDRGLLARNNVKGS